MAHPHSGEPEHDFPAGVARPALRALFAAGYSRLDQLTSVKLADLLKLHGMGPKAIGLLQNALNAKGLSFAGPVSNTHIAASKGQIFDSPRDWVRDHITEYVETDGRKGHRWRGLPTLLLITRGRKTGKLRRTALIYGQDGASYLLVASNRGAPDNPLWYLNLVHDPQVEIQVGAEKFTARARTATPIEKPRLWEMMSKIFPQYDKYQAKATREIPLVILEPVR